MITAEPKLPWLSCAEGKHDACLAKHPATCKCAKPPPDCGCGCHSKPQPQESLTTP